MPGYCLDGSNVPEIVETKVPDDGVLEGGVEVSGVEAGVEAGVDAGVEAGVVAGVEVPGLEVPHAQRATSKTSARNRARILLFFIFAPPKKLLYIQTY